MKLAERNLTKQIQNIAVIDPCVVPTTCAQKKDAPMKVKDRTAMKATVRPEQIDEILDLLDADDEIKPELETYIADLEARQPDRPARIAMFLEDIGSRYSAEIKASLEAYIARLEATQQPVSPGKAPGATEALYWHSVRREAHHRARALTKQHGNS